MRGNTDDTAYLRRRIAAEAEMASRTSNPDVRSIHERLRDEYARRARRAGTPPIAVAMQGTNPFARRLRAMTSLSAAQVEALCAMMSEPRQVNIERTVANEGDRPRRLHILLEGWAAHQKMLPDGRRLCPMLLVPGDICDIDALHIRTYDYSVVALTRCSISTFELPALLALCDAEPMIARALTWFGFVDNAIIQEAATSLGRRSARERVAHLFCELRRRLTTIGRMHDDAFDLPLTQERISDALGLTPVHVNRTLGALRSEGLIELDRRRCGSSDWEALEAEAGFSPRYLHLDGMR